MMVSSTLWNTCKYCVCRSNDGIAFDAFCGKTNSEGWICFPPCSSAIPAKGMWFCLIRDHEWAHGKPPIFNYWSPWLPGPSPAGWGSMLQGPSHSAMLPEVTRASWFSDWVCVHVCVCVCLPRPIFSLPCQDSFQSMACYRPVQKKTFSKYL